jgi:DNA (cytosine-5)-methyltransferase 1
MDLRTTVSLLPTPTVGMTLGGSEARSGDRNGEKLLPGVAKDLAEMNGGRLLPTPEAKLATSGPDYARFTRPGSGGPDLVTAMAMMPTPRASDGEKGGPNQRGSKGDRTMPSTAVSLADESGIQWGAYEPAIRRWEAIMGPAPSPTEPNARGALRLSPRFTEWMMGQPAGWITDPAIGISSKDMLKACGNGVVTQQAVAALQDMLDGEPFRAEDDALLLTPDGELPGQMSLLDGLEGTA